MGGLDQDSQDLSSPIPQAIASETEETLKDKHLVAKLDKYSLESVVELKISRFLDKIGTYYPEDMHNMIVRKIEKPLIKQILIRTGRNQVHAARILGINRNTLRKKMKEFDL